MSDILPAELPMTRWRDTMRLTQPQAGRALGYKKRMIQNFEAGTKEIPRAVILAMLFLLEHPELALDPDERPARNIDRRRRPRISESPDDPIVDERWFLTRDDGRTSR